jgi:hypothetical protein
VVTVVASGAPFVGLSTDGSNLIATTTAGQLVEIVGSTVDAFGLATGSVADGAVGDLVLPAAATAAAPYAVQGQTANFFGSATTPTLPYNLPPFATAGPVFAPAAQTAIAGGTLDLAAETSNATISATKAGAVKAPFGIVWVPATEVGANTALTANSFLFTDSGNVRTLIP